jgi:diaminopimelate epimerase
MDFDMKFKKMHGCGNDYIVVNGFDEKETLSQEQIAFLCKSHFGIGSEGLLRAEYSNKADFRMRMFNVDGTEAEMCGNGIRCISRFARDEGIVKKDKFLVETGAGIKTIELIADDVKVAMGRVEFLENPTSEYELHCVSVGNPHAIMIVDDVEACPVHELGPKIENHKGFPKKTNVEFVKVVNRNLVDMRVWERGCGETFACGTGSCASVAALNKLGLVDNDVIVKLKGGNLKIELVNGEIFMTGNAVSVYTGNIEVKSI